MPTPETQEPLAVTPPWPSLILYVPPFLGFLVDAGLVFVSNTMTKTHQQIMQVPPPYMPSIGHAIPSVA